MKLLVVQEVVFVFVQKVDFIVEVVERWLLVHVVVVVVRQEHALEVELVWGIGVRGFLV